MTRNNVVICPNCGHENLPGEDECVDCSAPLVEFDKSPDRQRKSPISRDRIGTLRLSEPKTVLHSDSVRDAVQAMIGLVDGCLLVMRGDKVVGIVTERDILYKVAGTDLTTDKRTVDDIMSRDPVRVHTTDRVSAAFNMMAVRGFRHLPVFNEEERLVGVITMSTLLAYLHEHYPKAASIK